jgi:hypothetical protein
MTFGHTAGAGPAFGLGLFWSNAIEELNWFFSLKKVSSQGQRELLTFKSACYNRKLNVNRDAKEANVRSTLCVPLYLIWTSFSCVDQCVIKTWMLGRELV